MKQLCAIISGGQEDTLCGIEAADFIIACDRGYVYARNAGIRPDLLVGDFDSYRGALPVDVPVLDLPVEKDDTDTMAAVRWAVSEGFAEIRALLRAGRQAGPSAGKYPESVFCLPTWREGVALWARGAAASDLQRRNCPSPLRGLFSFRTGADGPCGKRLHHRRQISAARRAGHKQLPHRCQQRMGGRGAYLLRRRHSSCHQREKITQIRLEKPGRIFLRTHLDSATFLIIIELFKIEHSSFGGSLHGEFSDRGKAPRPCQAFHGRLQRRHAAAQPRVCNPADGG